MEEYLPLYSHGEVIGTSLLKDSLKSRQLKEWTAFMEEEQHRATNDLAMNTELD